MVRFHPSIQRTLIWVLVIILLLIVIVFFFSFKLVRNLNRSQSEFASVMNQLQNNVDLISSLGNLNTASISQGEISENQKKLEEELDNVLINIYRNIPNEDDPLFYYRTLLAMLEFYKRETRRLLKGPIISDEIFKISTFLRDLHPFMINHAQQLAISIMAIETERQSVQAEIANSSMIRSFILILIMELIGFALIVLLVRRIYATIHHVAGYAGGLARHKWHLPDLQHYGYSDLQPVVKAFNNMKHSIADHIAEMEEKHRIEAAFNQQSIELMEQKKLLRESQLFALQSQMNPHFLFNTLNVIAKNVSKDKPEETVELIHAMSNILRFNLHNIRRLVPLKEEIEAVQSYILIQQHRFAEEITISLDIADPVPQEVLVPPMIIQPLIENSILHGLEGKLFNRQVKVTVSLDKNFVYIVTEDNGRGISPQQIQKLFQSSEKENAKHDKIGIANVMRRIELAFQGKGKVNIDSEMGIYTRISIVIPAHEGELNSV